MEVSPASCSDVEEVASCLASAFSNDGITGYLLGVGEHYPERLRQFFSLLLRARIALAMPVFVSREGRVICGASMGYATVHREWPEDVAGEWNRFEKSIPGFTERMAVYESIATRFRPTVPHYYLGVIGTEPGLHGRGIGSALLKSFCSASARDPASSGVYLETAQESNLRFYERAGFVETGRGNLGSSTLWCMFLAQGSSTVASEPRHDTFN